MKKNPNPNSLSTASWLPGLIARVSLLVAVLTGGASVCFAQTVVQPQVAAGGLHSLILKSDGSVWAFGSNSCGQLGDGSNTDRLVPVKIMENAQAIACGYFYSMILKGDGTVWATGQNSYGQLGDGTTTDRNTLIQVMSGVKAISTGYYHSLFLKMDGSAWACGNNTWGQLGDNSLFSMSSSSRSWPVQVGGLADIIQISAGGNRSLFLKSDKTLWDTLPNLTYYSYYYYSSTWQVASDVSSMSAGPYHAVYLKSNLTAWTFGRDNYYGQLGHSLQTGDHTQVLSNVMSVSAGAAYSLFVKADQTLWGCGNAAHFLFLGSSTTSGAPPLSQITQFADQTFAATANSNSEMNAITHSLFIKTDGTVFGCGYNTYGQLAQQNTGLVYTTPVYITTTASRPFIQTHPVSQSIASGSGLSISVTAAGFPSPTYQWRKNGVSIPGAVASTLSLVSAALADAGSYSCLITNVAGSVTSSAATLTVYPETNLVIRTQPASQGINLGNSVTFSVLATSIEPIGYQWRKNGISISGATSSSYTIPAVSSTDAANYTCIVSDPDELLLTTAATLTVQIAPAITSQPSSLTVNQNASAAFSITATGTPAPTYQWQLNGSDVSGATSASYTIASTQAANAGSYTCVVTNAAGSVTSSAATLTVQIPPAITSQPSSLTVNQNASAAFSITATGTPAPTYQWRLNGTNISGATAASYSVASAQAANAGSYTCVVTNAAGSVTSAAATLTVQIAPAITSQPTSLAVLQNSAAVLSITATGTPAPTYQWRLNGTNISGATAASYSIASAQAANAGSYTCVVTNAAGSVTSAAATLTVQIAPAITAQPTSLTVNQNASAVLSVTATGTPAPTYQWRLNGTNISSATSASYTIASTQAANAGTYTCVVTNVAGSVTSSAATLTVQIPPAITVQPTSLSVLQNAAAVFSITATGTPAPTYQWKFNGTSISGATETSYSIASAQTANAGNYTCVVTNAAGSVTSNIATLTVNIPVAITAQPASLSVNPAASATFGVTATGTGPLGYQWRKNGRDIAGATASTLTLTNVRFLDEAKYTCAVSNSFGSVLSTAATLTVTISPTSPDSDGDGISDALETYLSVFGLDPAVNSTEEWVRLLAMIPDLGVYYTASQMRDLAVGSPTLQRGVNGNFLLDVTVQESTDLNTWTKRTLSAPMLTYPGGVLRLELPPLDSSTQFYRLRSQPAP